MGGEEGEGKITFHASQEISINFLKRKFVVPSFLWKFDMLAYFEYYDNVYFYKLKKTQTQTPTS